MTVPIGQIEVGDVLAHWDDDAKQELFYRVVDTEIDGESPNVKVRCETGEVTWQEPGYFHRIVPPELAGECEVRWKYRQPQEEVVLPDLEECFNCRDRVWSLAEAANEAATQAEHWSWCAMALPNHTSAAMAALNSSECAYQAQTFAQTGGILAKRVVEYIRQNGIGRNYRTDQQATLQAQRAAEAAAKATAAADAVMDQYGESLRKHTPAWENGG